MNYENELKKIIKNLDNKNLIKVIHDCKKLINSRFNNAIVYNLFGLALQMKFINMMLQLIMFNKSIEI